METVTEKSNLPPLDKNQQERLQDQEAEGIAAHKSKSSRSQRSTNSPRSSSKRKARVTHSGSTKINDNYSAENRSEDGILIVEPSNAVLKIENNDVLLKIENLESAEAKKSRRRGKRSPRKENPTPANSGVLDEEKQESDYNDVEDDDNVPKAREVNPEEEELELDENGNPVHKGFRDQAPSPLDLSSGHQEPVKSPKLCTLGVELNSLSDSQAPQDPEHSHDHLTNVLTPKSARSIKRPKSTRSKKGNTPRNAKSLRSRSNRASHSIDDENGSKSKRRQRSPKAAQQRSLEDGILIVEPSNGVMEIEPSNDTLKIQTERNIKEPQQELDLDKLDSDAFDELVRKNGEQMFSSSTIAAFDSEDEVERTKTKTTTEEDIILSRDLALRDREAAEAAEKRYREEEEELRENQLRTLREKAIICTDATATSRAESRQSRMSRMSRKSRQAKNQEEETNQQETTQFCLGDPIVENAPQTLEATEPVAAQPPESNGELQDIAQNVAATLADN